MKKFLISILCCLCTLFLSLTLTSCDTTRDVAPEKIMTYVNKMQPIEEIKPLAIDVTYYELQEKVASEKIIISETEIYMFRDIETEDAVQIVDEYWFTIEKSEKDGVADKYIAYQKNKDENDGNLKRKVNENGEKVNKNGKNIDTNDRNERKFLKKGTHNATSNTNSNN